MILERIIKNDSDDNKVIMLTMIVEIGTIFRYNFPINFPTNFFSSPTSNLMERVIALASASTAVT